MRLYAGKPEYIVFFSGLEQIFVLVDNGQVAIPANLSGLTFAVATSSGTVVSVDTVLAGPTFFAGRSIQCLVDSVLRSRYL